jgi:hypothetical protein
MNRRINITALTLIAALMVTGIIAAQNTVTPVTPETTPALVRPEVTIEPEATPEFDLSAAQTITGGGIRFLLPDAVATGATVEEIEAVPLSEDMLPGDAMPAHTRIAFEGYDVGESFTVPELRIFNTADFADYNFGTEEPAGFPAELEGLKRLLAERPALYQVPYLPMLPVINAGQIFHTRQQYVEFAGGSGIMYLTAYGHDVSPITEGQVWLTFQGLSDDERTYITGAFPLNTNYLITEVAEDFDYEAFSAGYESYIQSIRTGLNDQISTVFEPSLTALTAMLMSISVE